MRCLFVAPVLIVVVLLSTAATGKRSTKDLIAFTRLDTDGPVIAVMRADGSAMKRVHAGINPAWSPDGERIAYTTSDGNTDLAIVGADGAGAYRLTNDTYPDIEPSWSPDGTHIAYVSTHDDRDDIYTVDVANGSVRRLTNNAAGHLHPVWSPDGSSIAFTSTVDHAMSIYTMHPDGTGMKRLTTSGLDWGPAWSPEGTAIAFASARSGVSELYLMDADGSHQRRASAMQDADDASWSPDARSIAFSRLLSIYVLDLRSGTSHQIASSVKGTDPAFRPGTASTEQDAGNGAATAQQTGRHTGGGGAVAPLTARSGGAGFQKIDTQVASSDAASKATHSKATIESAASSSVPTSHDRSALSASLRRPSEHRYDPQALAASAVGAAFLLLLVFPGNLFSNTFEEHYDEITGWFGRKPALRAPKEPSKGRRWFVIGAMGLATALLSGFIDPTFGFDRGSLVLVLSVLGLFIVLTGIRLGQIAYLNRHKTLSRAHVRVFPGALILAGLCVAISRIAAFLPGYVYGNLTGTASAPLSTKEKGRSQALNLGAGLVLAFSAWGLWCLVDGPASRPHPSLTVLVADATLAACFVGGIGSALFSLIPMRWLDGYDVMRYSRRLWVALALPTAFAFVHLLMQPSKGTTGSILMPFVLFCAFGGVSVLFWGFFRFRPEPVKPPTSPAPVHARDGTRRRREGSGSWSPA